MMHPRVKYLKGSKRLSHDVCAQSSDQLALSTETKRQLCSEMVHAMYQELDSFVDVQRIKNGDTEYSLDLCAMPRYEFARFINLNNRLVTALQSAAHLLENDSFSCSGDDENWQNLVQRKDVLDLIYNALADADVR